MQVWKANIWILSTKLSTSEVVNLKTSSVSASRQRPHIEINDMGQVWKSNMSFVNKIVLNWTLRFLQLWPCDISDLLKPGLKIQFKCSWHIQCRKRRFYSTCEYVFVCDISRQKPSCQPVPNSVQPFYLPTPLPITQHLYVRGRYASQIYKHLKICSTEKS